MKNSIAFTLFQFYLFIMFGYCCYMLGYNKGKVDEKKLEKWKKEFDEDRNTDKNYTSNKETESE